MSDQISTARRHLRHGAFEVAEAAAVKARADGADEVDCLVVIGRADMERGRLTSALRKFDEAVAVDKGRPEGYAWRVAALDQGWRADKAAVAADAALELFPNDVDLLITAGRAKGRRLAYNDALQLFAEAVQVAPESLMAQEWYVTGLRGVCRYDEAIAAVPATAESAVRLLAEKGHNFCAMGWHIEALGRYEAALALDELNRGSLRNVVSELEELGRFADAEVHLRALCRRLPEEAWPFLAYADHLSNCHRYVDAMEQYRLALQREPACTEAIVGAARAEIDLGRPDDAHARVRTALDADLVECRPLLTVALANALIETGQETVALPLVTEILTELPQCIWAMDLYVRILKRLGRTSESIEARRGFATRFPEQASLRTNLAWALSRGGDPPSALAEFTLAIRADQQSVSAECGRIRMLAQMGRAGEAAAAAEQAMADRPHDNAVAMELCYLHAAEGRAQEALDLVQQVIDRHPFYTEALEWRAFLLGRLSRRAGAEAAAAEAVSRAPDLNDPLFRYLALLDQGGRGSEVVPMLRDALDRRPGDIGLLQELASTYDRRGSYTESLAVIEQMARRFDTPSLAGARAAILIATRRFDEAGRLLVEAIKQYGQHPELLWTLTTLHEATGQLDDAIDIYRELLATSPDNSTAISWQIFDLRKLYRFGEAEEVARRACVRQPYSTTVRAQLAWVLEDRGRYEAARQEFVAAQELDPDDLGLVIGEATIFRDQRRLDEAQAILQAARTRWPDSPELRYELGGVFDDQRRYQDALVEYGAVLEAQPDDIACTVAKSAVLRSMRRFDEAEMILRRLSERWPYEQALLAELGWIRRDRNQHAAANLAFQELLRVAATPVERRDARCGLGWVALDERQFATAEGHFRTALREQPLSTHALMGVAWVLVRRDNRLGDDEAERLCLQVLERRPFDHNPHTCLGVLNFQRGQLSAAGYHLRRGVELDPYQGSHVDLGSFLAKIDRLDQAEVALRRALELDPDDSHAHIELGNVFLQRAAADSDVKHATQAAYHFRQARLTQPESGTAALGLALACAGGGSGGLAAAEQTLQQALTLPGCDVPKAQLRLSLARIIVQQGDATQRTELYEEALEIATDAINEAPADAAAYFVAGLAEFKLAENESSIHLRPWRRHRARNHLRRCATLDANHVEARRTLRALDRAARLARPVTFGSSVLVALATAILVVMWVGLAGFGPKLDSAEVVVLTPILIGLVALSAVLPSIVRLRLPGGVEADLYASLSQVSSGPTGTESVGPGRLSLGQGPSRVGAGPVGRPSRLQ